MRRPHDFVPAKQISFGATLGLFSPSEPLATDRPARLERSLELWSGRFNWQFSKNAFAESFYEAGPIQDRIADLVELLEDPGVAALVATWGGKSCNQLVTELPYGKFLECRKPIAGFSDVCVLLNAITASTGLITFAGPNVAGKLQETAHQDLDLIRGESVPPLGNQEGWSTLRPGDATGRLFGGNLSTFVLGLAGYQPLTDVGPIIFFWESASEPPQIIDQHLWCLVNAGFFESVVGMVVGDVTYEEEPRKDRPVDDLLSAFADRFEIPTVHISNFGHHPLDNPIIPIGGLVEFSSAARKIELLEDVVSA